jgi:hypothetical protein
MRFDRSTVVPAITETRFVPGERHRAGTRRRPLLPTQGRDPSAGLVLGGLQEEIRSPEAGAAQTGVGASRRGRLRSMPVLSGTTGREVFVAYPWTLYSNRAAYKRAYTSLQKALSVKFIFAEERISSGHVLEKIAEMIEQTAFGIYDVSGWNPNVTLEYGMARGLGALTFIAFNPDKTDIGDVPTDVRGYDRLQYADFDELSDAVATLVRQQLGKEPASDPLEDDRKRLLKHIGKTPGKTARELAEGFGERLDYVQLLIRRSGSDLETTGATRGVRYYRRGSRKKKK